MVQRVTKSSPRFQRFAGAYHLQIRTTEDLERALELDEAHWVATSAPIATLTGDPTFFALVDRNGDGRIRAGDVKYAIRWYLGRMDDPCGICQEATSARLAAIADQDPEGQRIRRSAEKILSRLDQQQSQSITLEQVRQVKQAVEEQPVSEAGVVLAEASPDPEVRQFIEDLIRTLGGQPHPSGKIGVTTVELEQFRPQAEAYLDWWQQGAQAPAETHCAILPLGEQTAEAYAAFAAVREKIDQYFSQCDAVALDPRLAAQFPLRQAEIEGLDLMQTDQLDRLLQRAPLCRPQPTPVLRFDQPLNPWYHQAMARLRTATLEPLLATGKGIAQLTLDDWQQIKVRLEAHARWLAAKPETQVESLGVERLRRYLTPQVSQTVLELIGNSTETAFVLDNIRLCEKLLLFQAHLLQLANNFVSFPDLYSEHRRAMFEKGTLVMDGRRFNLVVAVGQRAEHSQLAASSGLFVLYVELSEREGGSKVEAAVPVTASGRGNLGLGKRGVFYDLEGREWDARVLQIIAEPVNFGEALAAPFRRLRRAIIGRIESLTSEAEKGLDLAVNSAITPAAATSPAPLAKTTGPGPLSPQSVGGILAGGGIALAALGSAAAFITKTLSSLNLLFVASGIIAALMVVLIPTAILALIKLRQRDLSAILEGSGWAINARMRLTRSQRRFFTQRPPHPSARWSKAVALAVVIAGALGGAALATWLVLRRFLLI